MTSDSGSFRLEQRQEVAKVGPQTETLTLFGSAHIKGSITITIEILRCQSPSTQKLYFKKDLEQFVS